MNETTQNYEIQVDTKVETVTVGPGAKVMEVVLWLLFILPGLIFQMCKLHAENHFHALEQKIRNQASEIDNYLEQRVVVLQNCAKLVDRATELDQSVFTKLTELKYHANMDDAARNRLSIDLDNQWNQFHMLMEQYPDLRAHEAIQEAMRQNLMLQREITAARTLYNDAVLAWNREIFQWPAKRIVAAKHRYSTRIPFVASKGMKERANEVFF